MEQQTLRLAGGRHQTLFRAGSGAPLVWLHGINGIEADRPVVDELARRHAVIAPLAPGFEDLAELEDIRDIHELALHYDDVLDALGLEQATLIGNSFGAMIAAEVAAHVPGRVASLVLLSPLGLWNDAHPVADLFAVPSMEMPRLLYADLSKAPQTSGPSADIEGLLSIARGMTTVARFLWPIPDRGLARRLRRIRARTLLVHGQQDAFVPVAYVDDFLALLPNATAEIIPGAGHMLVAEAPDAVHAAIETFLGAAVAPANLAGAQR